LTPRSAHANQAIREESRARILESALELFASHGYERTTVRSIAERAGISQGLIYNYFQSKEDLLRALFERSMDDVRASFAAAERAQRGARTVALVRAAFDLLEKNERFWRISYGVRMQASVLAGLGDGLQEWTSAILVTLERYLREDGVEAPALESRILFATIDGVAQHYVLDPAGYPLEEVVERIAATYAPRGHPGPRRKPLPLKDIRE
jgi:AcrR family transcriptional regulator